MKALRLSLVLMFATLTPALGAGGYRLAAGRTFTSVEFEKYKDLIVLPAVINDTLHVRLILDTGTRSILLYGKRFAHLKNLSTRRKVSVAGWGSPHPIDASFSYPNQIQIGHVTGEALAIAVIPDRPLFKDHTTIDGIIGYELFAKFIVEINYQTQIIRMFERLPFGYGSEFVTVPLEVNRAMPQVNSKVVINSKTSVNVKLLVDTGSSLGLALFTKDEFLLHSSHQRLPVGIGLNGPVYGYDLYWKEFWLGDLPIRRIPAHVIDIDEHPDQSFTYCGSIGAAFLKKHTVIFDYPGERLLLKAN